MLPRLGLVMAGGLSAFQLSSVYAAAAEGEKSPKTSDKKKIRPSELPIYGEPEPPEMEFVPEKETSFHRRVSSVRKWTWNYLSTIQSTTDTVKDTYSVAKAHTIDALKYLQQDSSALPRIAVISIAGLGGIVAGYKGGKIRKTFYAAIGMTAAASFCYPRETVVIGRAGWREVRDFVTTTYRDNVPAAPAKPQRIVEPEETSGEEQSKQSAAKDSASKSSSDGNRGMSNPADKDMYSTRGS